MALIIRKEQMDVLQRDLDVRWYDAELVRTYPACAEASSAVRAEWITGGVNRALAFGLERAQVFQFLCFEQTFAPNCTADPAFDWARRILTAPDRTSADRMKALRRESVNRLLAIEAQAELDDASASETNDETAEQAVAMDDTQ